MRNALLLGLTAAAVPLAAQTGLERVQPGVISTDRNETFPAIDPVDGSLWFSVYDRGFDNQTIMVARPDGRGGWAAPSIAPFSGTHGDRAPRFSQDGRRLYFTSNRPGPSAERREMRIWMTERHPSGWTEPVMLPPPVNGPEWRTIHSAEIGDGSLFVASARPGGAGRSDIYRFRRNGAGWGAAERLPPPINDSLGQPDLWVAPDGTWMILVITDRPGAHGGDDLYVSYWRAGAWTEPKNLGTPVNSDEYEYGPALSPDAEWLYFTSHRGGNADIWRVRTKGLVDR